MFFDEFGERHGRPHHNQIAPRINPSVAITPPTTRFRGDEPEFPDCCRAASLYLSGSDHTKGLIWAYVFTKSEVYRNTFRSLCL